MPIDDAPKGEYTGLQFYSTRDIEKDEEILMDYSIYRVRLFFVGLFCIWIIACTRVTY